jgi:hypothetical protein
MKLRDYMPTHLGPFPIKTVRHDHDRNLYIITVSDFGGDKQRIYTPCEFVNLFGHFVDEETREKILGPKLETVLDAGEIVARRLWIVRGDPSLPVLSSMTMTTGWPYKCPLRGDDSAILETRGIHAYTLDFPADKILDYWSDIFHKRIIAIGTVYLWGNVIEFENTYRAQFAAVRTIERVWRNTGNLYDPKLRRLTVQRKIMGNLRELYCDPENIKREMRRRPSE